MKQMINKNAERIPGIFSSKMKRRVNIIFLTVMLVLSTNAMAQNNSGDNNVNGPGKSKAQYKTAIGLRAGETSGLTIKRFTGASTAIEGIVGLWPYAFSVTGLFERYVPTEIGGLRWYYGGGAHFAFNSGGFYYNYYYYDYPDSRRYYYHVGETGIGLDGMIGLEFKIPKIPIAVSLDLKPYFEITSLGRAYGSPDPGFGIKVIF